MATQTPHCEYCETTEGLRIASDGRAYGLGVEHICEDCFTGTDTGPSFDDLPLPPMTPAIRIARLRSELDDEVAHSKATGWGDHAKIGRLIAEIASAEGRS